MGLCGNRRDDVGIVPYGAAAGLCKTAGGQSRTPVPTAPLWGGVGAPLNSTLGRFLRVQSAVGVFV